MGEARRRRRRDSNTSPAMPENNSPYLRYNSTKATISLLAIVGLLALASIILRNMDSWLTDCYSGYVQFVYKTLNNACKQNICSDQPLSIFEEVEQSCNDICLNLSLTSVNRTFLGVGHLNFTILLSVLLYIQSKNISENLLDLHRSILLKRKKPNDPRQKFVFTTIKFILLWILVAITLSLLSTMGYLSDFMRISDIMGAALLVIITDLAISILVISVVLILPFVIAFYYFDTKGWPPNKRPLISKLSIVTALIGLAAILIFPLWLISASESTTNPIITPLNEFLFGVNIDNPEDMRLSNLFYGFWHRLVLLGFDKYLSIVLTGISQIGSFWAGIKVIRKGVRFFLKSLNRGTPHSDKSIST